MIRRVLVLLSVVSLLAPAAVSAHDGEHEQLLFSTINARYDATGTGLSVVPGARTLDLLQFSGGFTFQLLDRPFVLYQGSGADREVWSIIVQSQALLDLHAAVGFGFADLGIRMAVAPAIIWGADPTGQFPVQDGDVGGVGDLQLVPRVMLLDPRKKKFGLAVRVPVSLPTGQAARYMGDHGVGLDVEVIAELDLGRFRAMVNVAPLWVRPRVEYDGWVRQVGMAWGAGVNGDLLDSLSLRGEIWGTVSYLGSRDVATAEWSASVALRPADFVVLQLGAGSGIAGVGSPKLRAFGNRS